MTSNDRLVVIGGGHAGAELAVAAREAGWAGPIVLIGDENALPYHRPPLSKTYLAGEIQADAIALKARATYDKVNVELRLGVHVAALDRHARTLTLQGGETLDYAGLGLATGGRPRPLPSAAGGAERAQNFHYLRTLADVDGIRPRFEAGRKLVVVGGGYVGLEVAAVAVKHGLKVVVLEAAPRVLARVTAPEVSAFYEQVHRAAGVDVRTGVQVDGFELDEHGTLVRAVLCANGESIEADLVIAGIGLLPNTEMAASAGLAVEDGILVDDHARTSDPSIVAAGDCTRYQSLLYGRSIRLESVPNALEQARTAAATLCGKDKTYNAVPWFWSDQYDLKLKMVGLSQGYDRFVLRGSIEQKSFTAFYLQGDRVLSLDTVNRPQEFMLGKRLVAEKIVVKAEQLVDDTVPLKSLLPTPA